MFIPGKNYLSVIPSVIFKQMPLTGKSFMAGPSFQVFPPTLSKYHIHSILLSKKKKSPNGSLFTGFSFEISIS